MPIVSVILTSFNHASYLCRAIDSVLHQTFSDIELIILDDASSDGSWELIEAYEDPRIRRFRSESQGQIVHLTNRAISEYAAGDYVAIHHSDDLWAPEKLELQVALLNAQRDVGAVFTWAKIINEYDVEIANDWFHLKTSDRWRILSQLFLGINRLSHPSVMVRRQCYETIGLYRHALLQTDDAEIWSRLLLRYKVHVIESPLTIHRKFSDQSNISGVRDEVAIRTGTEWGYVRENFLSVTCFEEIVAIFPRLARFRNPGGCDVKFLMAMACLHECDDRSSWCLGLKWIYELFNDPVRRQLISELYSFTEFDFFELTGSVDVYWVGGEARHSRQIACLNTSLKNEQAKCDRLSEQIEGGEVVQENYRKSLADSRKSLADCQKTLASHIGMLQLRTDELRRSADVVARLDAALVQHVELLAMRDEALRLNEREIAVLAANIQNLEADTSRLWRQRKSLQDLLESRDRSIVNRDNSNAALLSRLNEVTDRLLASELNSRQARSSPLVQSHDFFG